MRIMTQTEAAKALKCSQAYISKLTKEEKIKKYTKGKVDLDEILQYKHGMDTETTQVINDSPLGKNQMTYAQAKTAREAYSAKKAKLEVEEMEGKLIRVDEVKKDAETTARIVTTKLLAIPNKIAPQLVGLEASEIKSNITDAINEVLSELHRRAF